MAITKSTYIRSIAILLLAGIYGVSINAARIQPAVESTLKAFDDADGKQQSRIAAHFFNLLNKEKFFDEPYTMPKGWHADSVRAEVWLRAGQYMFDTQDYEKGVEYSKKALALLRKGKDTEKTADCTSYLSSCYFRVSDYANAIKYAKEVLDMDRNTGDDSTVSSDLSNIAAIYLASKRPGEALPYALDAIRHSTAAGDSLRMAIQMGMASEICNSMGKHKEALDYAMRAYRLDMSQGRRGKAAIRLCQMAAPLMAMERLKEAETYLLKALPLLEEADNRQSLSIACNQLGSIALERKQWKKAAEWFDKALPFFVEQGDMFNERKAQEGLYQALRHIDPEKAMEHLERSSALKDSLYNHEMQEAISEHNAKYKNDELRMKFEDEGRQHGRTNILFATLIILAIGIIILLLCVNRRRKQKHDMIKRTIEEMMASQQKKDGDHSDKSDKSDQSDTSDKSTLSRTSSTSMISESDRQFLAKLTDAVNKVIGNGKMDYDALAYSLCMSRAQLNRKVKAITGYTTTDFILQIRISLAKQLLDTTDATIWEVALKCGMDNHTYFCTLFKKATGMSPMQYKNRRQ